MKIWKRMFPALAVALSAGAGWTGLLRVFAIDDRGALADFIPDIWSARFTEILYNRRVYGAGTNRNYEGDIAMAGDTVKVPTRTGAVTVKDYTKSTDIAAAQEMNGTVADLAVDEQKYFHVYLDDIQRRQQVPDLMDATLMHGAEQVAQVQDQYLMGVFAGAFANARRVISATATNATVALIIASFVELKQKMGEANIPENDRWCVVPPSIVAKLDMHFLSNSSAIYAPATTDESIRNGFAGRLLGFDLRVSNSIPTSGSGANQKLNCVASQGNLAVTMAEQIVQMEAYRPEARFGEAVKALYVYGALAAEPQRVFYNQFDDPNAS